MATTASALQQAASSAYASSHPQYYATNQQVALTFCGQPVRCCVTCHVSDAADSDTCVTPFCALVPCVGNMHQICCSSKFSFLFSALQNYQQPAAYSYAAWPAQQPAYSAAQSYAAQPDDSNPPVPGTEMQLVNDSSAGQQQVSLVTLFSAMITCIFWDRTIHGWCFAVSKYDQQLKTINLCLACRHIHHTLRTRLLMTHNSSGTSTVMSTITTMASGHSSSSSSSSNTTILRLNLRLVLHHGLPSLHHSSLLFYQHPHNSQLRQLTFQPLHLMPDHRQGNSCLPVSKCAELNSALIWMWPVFGACSVSQACLVVSSTCESSKAVLI